MTKMSVENVEFLGFRSKTWRSFVAARFKKIIKKSCQARRKVSMCMWLVLFIVLALSSVANGTLDYNIFHDPSREWDSSLQTITVEGYCFPEHCGRNVAKFNDLTVTLQLFDGTTELNDAPTVRISLFSFEIFLQTFFKK